jgi:phosphoglycerol transferase MdoB-like AlkP superfamily enzyme
MSATPIAIILFIVAGLFAIYFSFQIAPMEQPFADTTAGQAQGFSYAWVYHWIPFLTLLLIVILLALGIIAWRTN